MPADLPGFYYDPQKNRYFPVKGPIPGGASTVNSDAVSQKPTAADSDQIDYAESRACTKTVELLRKRELCGNVVTYKKRKLNFQEHFSNMRASQPEVWKYNKVGGICGAVLDHMHLNKHTSEGQAEAEVMVVGCSSGTLSLLEIEQVGKRIDYGVQCIPDHVHPRKLEEYPVTCHAPRLIRRSSRPEICMPSVVSSLKILGRDVQSTRDSIAPQKALLTTRGSESSRGSVYLLNFSDSVEFNMTNLCLWQRMHELASFDCTIWAADCAHDGIQAVIGTNLGARVVNLETGQSSWVFRSKSDVLSQRIDLSGNMILCGLRNGALLSVDVRQKEGSHPRLDHHKITNPVSTARKQSRDAPLKKSWFEIYGNVDTSNTTFMPSSISSLVFLRSYDHYFLASSMDGSINLYDQRMLQQGKVQSYSGHVNSHTRIQLGVDPSETFLMSGGEDSYVRIWNIKSGELVYKKNILGSIASTICWSKTGITADHQSQGSSRAWVGSKEGLALMLWP